MTKGRVEAWFEELENEVFDDWHSDKNRPVFKSNDAGVMFMSKKNPKEKPRNYGNIRMDALASPTGYKPGEHHSEEPLANWMSHWHTPETYEEMKENLFPDSERMAIYMSATARNSMKTSMKNHLQEDDESVVVNPIDVIDTLSDKQSTYEHLEDAGLPTIPTVEASELLYNGKTQVRDEIGETEGIGAVIKSKKGSGGSGVKAVDSLDKAQWYLSEEEGRRELINETDKNDLDPEDPDEIASNYIIQAKIPHESDIRANTFGEKVGNASRRISPEGSMKTNIGGTTTKIDGESLSIYGKAPNVIENDRGVSLDVSPQRELTEEEFKALAAQRDDILGKGAAELAKDTVTSFDYDEDLPRAPIAIGMDMLEADTDELEHLPDEYVERAMEYEDDGTAYLIPELNHMPANTTDQMARITGKPEQLGVVNLYSMLHELSTGEPLDEDEIVENDDSKVWNRAEQYFPGIEDEQQYKEAARANLR